MCVIGTYYFPFSIQQGFIYFFWELRGNNRYYVSIDSHFFIENGYFYFENKQIISMYTNTFMYIWHVGKENRLTFIDV